MTQEDIQLLLIDLCARLPYGVICTDNRHGDSRVFYVDAEDKSVYYTDFDEYGLIENCKPYLRPMSSMTEEEKKEYNKVMFQSERYEDDYAADVDWLNKKMFAYRTIDGKDMFELGLARQAPEGMYK